MAAEPKTVTQTEDVTQTQDVDDEINTIVVDNGSGIIKAGFTGSDAPEVVFNNEIGRPAYNPVLLTGNYSQYFIGKQLDIMRGVVQLEHPMTKGVIDNIDTMEVIWKHIFENELKVETEGKNVLISEVPLNPQSNRSKIIRSLFEAFNVSGAYVDMSAVLSLYSYGLETGLVVDSGHSVTYTVPVYEGYALPHGIERINIGGNDVTDYMAKLLSSSNEVILDNNEFVDDSSKYIVNSIKHDIAYIPSNIEEEENVYLQGRGEINEYKLPDGKVIQVRSEKFACTELLYNPILIGKHFTGIHQLVSDSIYKCDINVRETFFQNIVLVGGNTLINGFVQRLENELRAINGHETEIKIAANADRAYSAWIGGQILSGISTFKDMWITKEEYHDEGSRIILRKLHNNSN